MSRRKDGAVRIDSKLAGHWDEATTLYAQGLSTREVGDRFGMSHSNVVRDFRAHGIQLRSHSEANVAARRRGRGWRKKLVVGRAKHSLGYLLVLWHGHPRADSRGYVQEAVLVAEQAIGRPLARNEVVHHRNGSKADNTAENLQVLDGAEHMRLHYKQGDLYGLDEAPSHKKGRKVIAVGRG